MLTEMPGDLVFGDREGLCFIPPRMAEGVLNNPDKIYIHDERTRKKFDEGKDQSSEMYSSPSDPGSKEGICGVSEDVWPS